MKKVLLVCTIALMSLTLSGCFLDSDSVTDILDSLSGPDEYASAFQTYKAVIEPAVQEYEGDALGELDTILTEIMAAFENGEWDAENSRWYYENVDSGVETIAEITQENGEVYCHFTQDVLGLVGAPGFSLDVITGDAYYHPASKSFKVNVDGPEWALWMEFATPDDGVTYFTQLAFIDEAEAPVSPGDLGAPYSYADKLCFLADGTDFVGRLNINYFTDMSTFLSTEVTSIYRNSPATWDAWKTMWESGDYGEFTYDPVNGYSYQWIGM